MMNVMIWFKRLMRGKPSDAGSSESKQKCHSGRSYGRRRSMCTCELQEQRKTLEKEREIAGEAMERLVK
jgi:hypothetical protein